MRKEPWTSGTDRESAGWRYPWIHVYLGMSNTYLGRQQRLNNIPRLGSAGHKFNPLPVDLNHLENLVEICL